MHYISFDKEVIVELDDSGDVEHDIFAKVHHVRGLWCICKTVLHLKKVFNLK